MNAEAPAAAPRGLGSAEAGVRLQRDGPNALPQPERRGLLVVVLAVLREPMLLLLLAATGVYLLLGDASEAAWLGASLALVVGLTVYQEQKAERALQALRDLSSPRARVLRDGAACVIPARDIVVGDVLLVTAGDRLAADARVLEATDLQVDESLLTGESLPQDRTADAKGEAALLHASTLVVRGHGVAEVVATGERSAVGRIGAALRDLPPERTPLQREMRYVVLAFAGLSLAISTAMTAWYVLVRGDWLAALLAGLTLAIATIPEEFPVVLAVFLALGAWRMAQQHALVRRPPAIEALGAITVLCTDKTGTLTENRMRVAGLVAGDTAWDGQSPLSSPLREVLRCAVQASPPLSHDPMERALHEAWTADGDGVPLPALVRQYAFSHACPAVACAWEQAGMRQVACKGAPEAVARLCSLDPGRRATLHATVHALAAQGLRVLGIASARLPPGAPLPPALDALPLSWEGLVAFVDPLRAGVRDAVLEARAAGVRVVMLTGDHPGTARAIAVAAGIGGEPPVLGETLDEIPAGAELHAASVYARVRPEHKLQLVEALKRRGEVVAMTGDGVNDAPALAAAHVGIAMGGRGTDVAREAAGIVLLDDNFVSVVRAIRLGRGVYDNLRRTVRYILAVHVPITGLALLPLLLGGPLVLTPLHVVFLQLIIDPACSLVFERDPPDANVMKRPPRSRSERMVSLALLASSLTHGALMLGVIGALLVLAQRAGLPAPQRSALAFGALIAGNIGLIGLYRGGHGLAGFQAARSATFGLVAGGALLLLAVVTWIPTVSAPFRFGAPPITWWTASLAAPLLLAIAVKAAGSVARGARPRR